MLSRHSLCTLRIYNASHWHEQTLKILIEHNMKSVCIDNKEVMLKSSVRGQLDLNCKLWTCFFCENSVRESEGLSRREQQDSSGHVHHSTSALATAPYSGSRVDRCRSPQAEDKPLSARRRELVLRTPHRFRKLFVPPLPPPPHTAPALWQTFSCRKPTLWPFVCAQNVLLPGSCPACSNWSSLVQLQPPPHKKTLAAYRPVRSHGGCPSTQAAHLTPAS